MFSKSHNTCWGSLYLNPGLLITNLDSTHYLFLWDVLRDFFSQAFYHLLTWLPHYHTDTWQLTGPPSPVLLSCVDKPSSFSGNSPNLTAPFLLILFYPWQKKGSSPQNDTCPSYSLAIQQNLSFSLHWFFSSPTLMAHLLSAAETCLEED